VKFGTTFSPKQLQHLSCPIFKALDKAIELNFDHLRICTYWDETEKAEGQYDWSQLEKILNVCQKKQQGVILTLGVKAPRYPEFHFPDWIKNKDLNNSQTQKKILNFIKQTVKKFKNLSCIKYYQVENEALDPSGPDSLTIPFSFLKKEIALVKKLDNRKIIVSLWANELSKRNLLPKLDKTSDIVGLDLYYQQFIGKILNKSFYTGPLDSQQKIAKLLRKLNQKAWIMELQAEPWEANEQNYLAKNPKSISPEKIKSFYQKANKLPVSTIFFWGFEYWFYQLNKNKNNNYFKTILEIRKKT
jgi:glycosyl hydrolase family 10